MARKEVIKENLLDLTSGVIKKYIKTTDHQITAISLWALHTHVYRQFVHTPRLAITSPVENCGKSTVLDLLKMLAAKPLIAGQATPASLFPELDTDPTLLLDEAHNLGIGSQKIWQQVLNDGYKRGAVVRRRGTGKEVEVYNAHLPVAVAGIGTTWLYGELSSRSHVIFINRVPPGLVTRFDENDRVQMAELGDLHVKIWQWAKEIQVVKLNTNPPIPKELNYDNRIADKWRALFAIADDLGRGDIARAAAIGLVTGFYENIKITLLRDIRTVFDQLETKSIPTNLLVQKLLGLESEVNWLDFDYLRRARTLDQRLLARILSDFHVASPHLIRWPENHPSVLQKPIRGYTRAEFEEIWKMYVPSNVVKLKQPKGSRG